MYGFMGTCEHTALRYCDPIPGFNVRVNVDFLTESMENGAVGLLVNDLRYVSREDGSFDDGDHTPISSTATRREYESSSSRIVVNLGMGVTNFTYNVIGLEEDDPFFIEIAVIHVYGESSKLIFRPGSVLFHSFTIGCMHNYGEGWIMSSESQSNTKIIIVHTRMFIIDNKIIAHNQVPELCAIISVLHAYSISKVWVSDGH